MDAATVTALIAAADKPGFVSFVLLFGLISYWLFNRGIIVPGMVSGLLVTIAKLEAAEASCRQRNDDLEASFKQRNDDLAARIVALEAQLMAHVRSDLEEN